MMGLEPLMAAFGLEPPVEVLALPGQGSLHRTVGVRTGGGRFVWKIYAPHSDPAAIR